MSLFVTSLNSGSNGNCYYVGNEHEAVLIDGGISCRETEKRLLRLNLSIKKVKAIFISHEHGDHIHGVPGLCKKYKLPVYVTPNTLRQSGLALESNCVYPFQAYEPVHIGGLTITAFPKLHDAIDPHSFIISNGIVNVGVFTDIGFNCEHVIKNFAQCHAVFLESNYDEEMLEKGGYPYYLKNRIRNGKGHLSNTQAAHLFKKYKPAFMSHVFLSHLSRNNNSPQLVEQLFSTIETSAEIIIAPRDRETALYLIEKREGEISQPFIKGSKRFQTQLSLFQ